MKKARITLSASIFSSLVVILLMSAHPAHGQFYKPRPKTKPATQPAKTDSTSQAPATTAQPTTAPANTTPAATAPAATTPSVTPASKTPSKIIPTKATAKASTPPQKTKAPEGPLRVEIPVKSLNNSFYALPVAKQVLTFYPEEGTKSKGLITWNFVAYDTMFKPIWSKELAYPKKMAMAKYDVEGNKAYILLCEPGEMTTMGSLYSKNFEIITVDMTDGSVKALPSAFPFSCILRTFEVADNTIYIGGNSLPSRAQIQKRLFLSWCLCYIPCLFGSMNFHIDPMLLAINTQDNHVNVTPFNLKGNGKVTDVKYDENSKTADVFLLNKPDKHTSINSMGQVEEGGKQTGTIRFKTDSKILTSAKVHNYKSGEKYIVGTYSLPQKLNFMQNFTANYYIMTDASNAGLYIAKVNNGEQESIKFYPANKLKNFFTYKPGKQNTKQAKKKMKKEINLPYGIVGHDIIEFNDELIFVGEMYFLHYHTEVYTDAQGHIHTQQVFDGFEFTNAYVAAFDLEGNMLWENSCETGDIITQSLKERVKVTTLNNGIVLTYAKKGSVYSRAISTEGVMDEESAKTKVATSNLNQVVKENYQEDVNYWYDTYFVAFGLEKIENKKHAKGESKRARLFYMNKMSFQ